MNDYWTCKQGAVVLDLRNPASFPKAWNPSRRKVALLMLANPLNTWAEIHEEMQLITRERQRLALGSRSLSA